MLRTIIDKIKPTLKKHAIVSVSDFYDELVKYYKEVNPDDEQY